MSQAIENLVKAQKYAMSIRPKVGGFPYLAEALRLAGVTENIWTLPSCQSVYYTNLGVVVQQGQPLITQTSAVPQFNEEALIKALRIDQAGQSTFPEFLQATWNAGITNYEVDFAKRTCKYFGVNGEMYLENYSAVEIKK